MLQIGNKEDSKSIFVSGVSAKSNSFDTDYIEK